MTEGPLRFYYARSNPTYTGVDDGLITAIVAASDPWQRTVAALCRSLEPQLPRHLRSYPLEKIGNVLLYRWLSGTDLMKDARKELGGDCGELARSALGFTHPPERPYRRSPMKRHPAVPSEATISRYLDVIDEKDLANACEQFFRAARDAHMATMPVAHRRLLSTDGTEITICGVGPHFYKNGPKKGQLRNAKSVTVPDAGSIGRTRGSPGRDGWKLTHLDFTLDGTTFLYRLVLIQERETKTVIVLLGPDYDDEWTRLTRDWPPGALGVLTGDSGLHSHWLRHLAHQRRFVEIIHETSHAKGRPATDREVARKNNEIWQIEDYPGWEANGHGEVFCKCRDPIPARTADLSVGARGQARVAMEGYCEKHGHIEITTEKYYRDTPTKTFRIRHDESEKWRAEDIDVAFGSPFTHNDPRAAAYGKAHHGLIEGVHGLLGKRFHLITPNRQIRNLTILRAQTAAILGSLHVLADHAQHHN